MGQVIPSPFFSFTIGGPIGGTPNNDGSILWNGSDGKLHQDLPGNFTYDPDGTLGALGTPNTLYAGGFNGDTAPGILALWDVLYGFWVPITVSNIVMTVAGNVVSAPVTATYSGLTATKTPVVSATTPNDGQQHAYSASAWLLVASITTKTLALQVVWTDPTATVSTVSMFPQGATTVVVSAAGTYLYAALTLRANPNTTVEVNAVVTGATGSINYGVCGVVTQLS